MLSIGEFARASGLSAKALRLYDENGLLLPARVDPSSGYRSYEPAQLDRARLVARLRLAGVPLATIREVADAPDPVTARAALRSHARQVEADAASRLALLASVVAAYDEEAPPVSTTDTTSTDPTSTDPTTSGGTTAPPPVVATRTGRGARATQEDAVLAGPGLYAVADGVGEVAPGLARHVLDHLAASGVGSGTEDPVARLDDAVAAAAADVARRWSDAPGGGTTLTAVLLAGDPGGRVVLAHLGDSRALLVRDGRVQRLTRDHTVTQTLVDEGRLTEEEARSDERRVRLNRAIGTDGTASPDLALHDVRPGDRLVLTTDGVHGVLGTAALTDLVTADATPVEVADALAAAVESHGAPDNYAVVVLDLP